MMDGMMNHNMMNTGWMMLCMATSTLFALGIAVTVIVQAVLLRKILRELRQINDKVSPDGNNGH
jgi:hypothetical protein